MPRIRCETHGTSGAVFLCSHLSVSLAEGTSMHFREIKTDEVLWRLMCLCDVCVTTWVNLPEDQKNSFFDELKPVCQECFDAAIRK